MDIVEETITEFEKRCRKVRLEERAENLDFELTCLQTLYASAKGDELTELMGVGNHLAAAAVILRELAGRA